MLSSSNDLSLDKALHVGVLGASLPVSYAAHGTLTWQEGRPPLETQPQTHSMVAANL